MLRVSVAACVTGMGELGDFVCFASSFDLELRSCVKVEVAVLGSPC